MEQAMVQEIEKSVSALAGALYPTNAPQDVTRPYLVYSRVSTDYIRTLDGIIGQNVRFLFTVLAQRYADMKATVSAVIETLNSWPGTEIGTTASVYVQDVEINDTDETWEPQIGLNCGTIDFTIYA